MYARSRNERKYSSTPVVKIDEEGKEIHLLVCEGKKKDADELADKIVSALNDDRLSEIEQLLKSYRGIVTDKSKSVAKTDAQRIILATQVSVMKSVIRDIEQILNPRRNER